MHRLALSAQQTIIYANIGAASASRTRIIGRKVLPNPLNLRQSNLSVGLADHNMYGDVGPTNATAGSAEAAPSDPILQYVILRKDLWKELKWPLGSVVAQGCHAATAALWLSKDQKITQTYCAPVNIDHMHKV